MLVLCMEEWTNVFNILLFKMNFMLNQVCVSCGMCVGTNEASQETNEENRHKNSRQPANNFSKQMTELREATNMGFFQAKKDKESKKITLKPQDEMNEEARKD